MSRELFCFFKFFLLKFLHFISLKFYAAFFFIRNEMPKNSERIMYLEWESNPHGHYCPRDFKSLMSLYHYSFHYQSHVFQNIIHFVCGLELTFIIRCVPSILYTFPIKIGLGSVLPAIPFRTLGFLRELLR